MKIKVCGLKDSQNIAEVAALKPDYMGFICYDQSPRFIASLPVELLKQLPDDVYKTAVFVNEYMERILMLIEQFGFNAVQLHGNESPEFCEQLRPKVKVYKAFGLDETFDFDTLNPYYAKVDGFVFDTKTDTYGGSGKSFNWDILNKYELDVPFLLAGGISLDNIEEVKKIIHPQFYGIDLNSRFETAPGNKNIERLRKAFSIIRQSN